MAQRRSRKRGICPVSGAQATAAWGTKARTLPRRPAAGERPLVNRSALRERQRQRGGRGFGRRLGGWSLWRLGRRLAGRRGRCLGGRGGRWRHRIALPCRRRRRRHGRPQPRHDGRGVHTLRHHHQGATRPHRPHSQLLNELLPHRCLHQSAWSANPTIGGIWRASGRFAWHAMRRMQPAVHPASKAMTHACRPAREPKGCRFPRFAEPVLRAGAARRVRQARKHLAARCTQGMAVYTRARCQGPLLRCTPLSGGAGGLPRRAGLA